MKFSHRTDWQFESNRIGQALAQLSTQGKSVLDLTCSNPTQVNLYHFPRESLSALANPKNCLYKPDAFGGMEARRAVAQYYHEHGINVDVAQIVLTSSTSEAYSFLFRLLMDPHDTACFPRPGYPLFELLTGIHDVCWKTYRLGYTGSTWRLDQNSVQECAGRDTKAMIIVNPNNPTGSFLSSEDMKFLCDVCRENEMAVICDEVFLDYSIDENCTVESLAGYSEHLTFTLGGLSKTLGLPQMKLSWIVVNGPKHQKQEALKRLEMIADIYLSVNAPVQNALGTWLAQRASIQRPIQQRVRNNVDFLKQLGAGDVEYLPAQAGWCAVLKLPVNFEEEAVCLELLTREGVSVYPGYFFDFDMEPVIVVSLLVEEQVFQQGIQKIITYLKK